jgi:hypothetical protein
MVIQTANATTVNFFIYEQLLNTKDPLLTGKWNGKITRLRRWAPALDLAEREAGSQLR